MYLEEVTRSLQGHHDMASDDRIFRLDFSIRYPDITFDSSCSTFECPACQNVCNCSVCSRKRGEIYYGERTGGLPNAKAKARKAALLPLDPGVPIPVPAQANTYWATVYGLSGEKVGTAFVGEDGNDRVVVARPVQAQSAMRAERVRVSRRARVFVGRVQEAWGLGMWRVRDLEAVDTGKGKGKGKGVEGVAGRMYVGKKWLLGVPLRSHSCVSQPVEWTLERVSSPLLSDGEEEREREEEDCERGRMPGSEHEEDRVDVGVSLGEQAVEYAIRSAFAQLLLRPVDAE